MKACNKHSNYYTGMKKKVFLVFLDLWFLWTYWPGLMNLFLQNVFNGSHLDHSQCSRYSFLESSFIESFENLQME